MSADPCNRPLRFGYADPPYPGMAAKHYRSREVDHARLVAHLVETYPDGWALSTSSTTLAYVLSLCPPGVRVAAWVKTWAPFKPGINPAYVWEPLIWTGGRPRGRGRTVRDWLACPIATRRGLSGAKPEAFAFWLFDLWNLQPGDVLDDLFPGTGAMTRALERYTQTYRGPDHERESAPSGPAPTRRRPARR